MLQFDEKRVSGLLDFDSHFINLSAALICLHKLEIRGISP
jgi:hypothetical protein